MSYQSTIGPNYEISLPDKICDQLGINVGDILKCELLKDTPGFSLKKNEDQSLSDKEVSSSDDLTRVTELTLTK